MADTSHSLSPFKGYDPKIRVSNSNQKLNSKRVNLVTRLI